MSTLGYWDVRGLAEPIRLLLSYLKVQYTEKLYQFDSNEWIDQDKQTLDHSFPNLPYYIDGDVKIVQSTAIPIYIIKKHQRYDLIGENIDGTFNQREIKVIEMIGVINDIRTQIIRLCFNPDFKKLRENYFAANISGLLNKVVDFLGQKDYLLDSLTYADFIFYDTIILLFYLYPQSKCQALIDYTKRFENIDGIKQYVETPHSYDKYFFHKIYASWSGPNSD
ncbi:hypothetical protein ABPG74_014443 [Tetrahymena malaccensis]